MVNISAYVDLRVKKKQRMYVAVKRCSAVQNGQSETCGIQGSDSQIINLWENTLASMLCIHSFSAYLILFSMKTIKA